MTLLQLKSNQETRKEQKFVSGARVKEITTSGLCRQPLYNIVRAWNQEGWNMYISSGVATT